MRHISLARPALLGAALLALPLAACGKDDGGDGDDAGGSVDEQQLIDQLMANGADEEEARCVIDQLGEDAERLIMATDDLAGEDQELAEAAMLECVEAFQGLEDAELPEVEIDPEELEELELEAVEE